MKPNIISLILIAAALLPNFAYAGTDRISASSEGGRYCNLATTTVVIADMDKKADPMEDAVNAMVDSTDDPVLASYYSDLYHAPAPFKAMEFVWAPDAYEEAVHIALLDPATPEARLIC
ncbi:MAG: hypothetical protein WAW10_14015 [Gallionella sp.]